MNYVIGDATAPVGDGPKVIAHICNDVGKWGSGFVMAVSARWPHVREMYIKWFKGEFGHLPSFELGEVQFVYAEEGIYIANMIAQHDIYWKGPGGKYAPIRYPELALCLFRVTQFAKEINGSVHMPRIGTQRAGGKWPIIEPIIQGGMVHSGINVTVYDLAKRGE